MTDLNPWDIRPRSADGSATADEVYRAIGMALTSWEYAENALADVFALFVGAREIIPPREPAVRAYGVIAGFKTRLDMVQAAAESYFQLTKKDAEDEKVRTANDALRERFKRTAKCALKLSERRNNIAHGIVGQHGRGHFLTPPLYAAKKYPLSEIPISVWERAAYAFTAEDIHSYRERFDDLYDELSTLADDLRLWPRRP
jgi:hypothetical protein